MSQESLPDFDGALALVRRASCNCYSFEPLDNDSIETRASLITQNFKLADPCTFRIVVKNTTLFMNDEDPLRLQAYNSLDSLVRCAPGAQMHLHVPSLTPRPPRLTPRSFSKLDDALLGAGEWESERRTQVVPLLATTKQHIQDLKDLVTECIASDL